MKNLEEAGQNSDSGDFIEKELPVNVKELDRVSLAPFRNFVKVLNKNKVRRTSSNSEQRKSNYSLKRVNVDADSQKQQDFIDEFFKSIEEKERRTVKNTVIKKSPNNFAKISKTAAKKKVSVKKKSSAKPITKKSAKKK
jgi:hypothetical protein